MERYAQIVFGLPLKEPFDYLIPDSLIEEVEIGKRVYVPFRNKKIVGYCVGKSKKSKSSYNKEIISVLDKNAFFSKKFLSFLKELSLKYFASWGEMLELATPAYLRKPKMVFLEKAISEVNKIYNEFFLHFSKEIIESIENGKKDKFLVFDDYMQNKRFELYYELCKWMLGRNRDVLLIVPEIYIVEELYNFFKKNKFPYEIIIYHSNLKEKEAFINWWKIMGNFPKLVVGTKMVVFHPQENVGLIIVDEENSSFYKNDEFPFYNARDIGFYRASFFKIPIVFASNSPSVETLYKVEKNILNLVDLREKSKNYPEILAVDLNIGRKKTYITKSLELKIAEILEKKEKIFLFFNRRGFATFIECRKCGEILKCERCDKNLIYHFFSKKLICHYCGFSMGIPSLCPECEASYMRYQGLGTEKLESELSRLFPKAKVSRIDLDVKKERILKDIARDFQESDTDILVGTSLLLKLPPLPNLGLLGIINLEQLINFPDFRASERGFSLLINFLRLIKKEDRSGTLLIQTYNPESNLIKALRNFDYEFFYKDELNSRKELGLPPFKNIIILNLRGKSKRNVEKNANLLVEKLNKNNIYHDIFISDAIPHPIFKLRDKYRWQIFIKSGNIKKVFSLLEKTLQGRRKFRGSILTVDIEPAY